MKIKKRERTGSRNEKNLNKLAVFQVLHPHILYVNKRSSDGKKEFKY